MYRGANDPASPKEKGQQLHASYSFMYRKCLKVSADSADNARDACMPPHIIACEFYPVKYIQIGLKGIFCT